MVAAEPEVIATGNGYNTKNYMKNGGREWVIGGKLTIAEGAEVDDQAGALGGGGGAGNKVRIEFTLEKVSLAKGYESVTVSANMTYPEVVAALNGRGLEAVEVVIYSANHGDVYPPVRICKMSDRLYAYCLMDSSSSSERSLYQITCQLFSDGDVGGMLELMATQAK